MEVLHSELLLKDKVIADKIVVGRSREAAGRVKFYTNLRIMLKSAVKHISEILHSLSVGIVAQGYLDRIGPGVVSKLAVRDACFNPIL